MSPITTHVLDLSTGRPAAGVAVVLERGGKRLAAGKTDSDGRCRTLLKEGVRLKKGAYRLVFQTGKYFGKRKSFHPEVAIAFTVTDPKEHYHVPLLLGPWGYTTYRGS